MKFGMKVPLVLLINFSLGALLKNNWFSCNMQKSKMDATRHLYWNIMWYKCQNNTKLLLSDITKLFYAI